MNETYNYEQAVFDDLKEFIEQNIDLNKFFDEYGNFDKDRAVQEINDVAVDEDSITGNCSGSYTFSRAKAEENLSGNLDLLADAVEELEMDNARIAEMLRNPESCDSTIRFNLVFNVLPNVLDEILN